MSELSCFYSPCPVPVLTLIRDACSLDLPLPIECDDEFWETADPEEAFKQPEGKPCKMSYWVEFLKLLEILGFAQRTIVSREATPSPRFIFSNLRFHLVLVCGSEN